MILETDRLLLRAWNECDAEDLFEYAKDPLVGPSAGWPVHTSIENSREIIRNVLAIEESYAIVLKCEQKVVGSIGLMIGKKSNMDIGEDEGEIGYWIGVPFWGCGLIPDAVRELQRHAFETLHLKALWCGYFEGNEKSKRVQEKCGFHYHHTCKDKEWPLLQDVRTEHCTFLSKETWKESLCKGNLN